MRAERGDVARGRPEVPVGGVDGAAVALGRLEDDAPLHHNAVRADRLGRSLAAVQAPLQQGPRHQVHVLPRVAHLLHCALHPHHRLPDLPDLGVCQPDASLVRVAAARLAVRARRVAADEPRGPGRSGLDQGDRHRSRRHRHVRPGVRLPVAGRRAHDVSLHPQPTVRSVADALFHPVVGLPLVPLPVRAVGHHHPRPDEGPHPLPRHPLHLYARLHAAAGRHIPPGEAPERVRPRHGHGRRRRWRADLDAARHVRDALLRAVRTRRAGESSAGQPPPDMGDNASQGRVRRLSDHHLDRAHQPSHRHDVGHVPAHPGAVGHGVEVRPSEAVPQHESDIGDAIAHEPAHQTVHVYQDTH